MESSSTTTTRIDGSIDDAVRSFSAGRRALMERVDARKKRMIPLRALPLSLVPAAAFNWQFMSRLMRSFVRMCGQYAYCYSPPAASARRTLRWLTCVLTPACLIPSPSSPVYLLGRIYSSSLDILRSLTRVNVVDRCRRCQEDDRFVSVRPFSSKEAYDRVLIEAPGVGQTWMTTCISS